MTTMQHLTTYDAVDAALTQLAQLDTQSIQDALREMGLALHRTARSKAALIERARERLYRRIDRNRPMSPELGFML